MADIYPDGHKSLALCLQPWDVFQGYMMNSKITDGYNVKSALENVFLHLEKM